MEIKTKAEVNQEIFYLSDKGRVMSNKVESIDIRVGTSTYRTSHWVETAKSNVQVSIMYKLFNVPAGYILMEDSIYTSKEELVGGLSAE